MTNAVQHPDATAPLTARLRIRQALAKAKDKAKDEKNIYDDMRKLGCQLKTCTLKFGDGGGAKIQMPIK